MGLRRAIWQRVINVASDEIPNSTRSVSDDVARQAAIAKADALWRSDEHRMAFHILRKARLDYGPSATLQFEYGKKALELGRYWAAREALQDAVELDETHLEAVELFLEANYVTPTVQGVVTQVVTNLASILPRSEEFDAEAATLLLPSMRLVEVVDRKIRMLRYSDNAVAKHIGLLAPVETANWSNAQSNNANEQNELIAKLILVLSRREYDVAVSYLKGLPQDQWPVRALRLAIRKELRNQQFTDARILLSHYLEIRPDESWATKKFNEIKDEISYLSPSQIIEQGFPFPEKSERPLYRPDRRRVLYLLHSSLPFHSMGYATRTQGLLKGIRNHGWNVDGVTRLGYPYDMPSMESLGPIEKTTYVDSVPYHRLSFHAGPEKKNPIQNYVSRYVAALKCLASEQQPFLLHAASNHWNGLAAVTAARELGIPSLYEVRGLWEITRGSRNPEWAYGKMYNYMARLEADAATNADKVITITQALKDELVGRGVNQDKITVVPNGVDARRFLPRKKNLQLASKLGIGDRAVVGYVGSILNYEGIGLLLDAAQKLSQERDDVYFLFVGDGAELEEYQERVVSEQLTGMVRFIGRVPHSEVEDYYSLIDICPFPRLPWPVCEMVSPLKPFEAMAMEKAVIASDVGALQEVVSHEKTGLLCKKGDADSLTHVLRTLLDRPRFRRQLAKAARRWVKDERDWDSLADKVSEIYKSF